jgi:hypothetical protein
LKYRPNREYNNLLFPLYQVFMARRSGMGVRGVMTAAFLAAVLPACAQVLGLGKDEPPRPYDICGSRTRTCPSAPQTMLVTQPDGGCVSISTALLDLGGGPVWGVAWRKGDYAHGKIMFLRVDMAGTIVGGTDPLYISSEGHAFGPDVAAAPASPPSPGFGIAWDRDLHTVSCVKFSYVDASGTLVTTDNAVSDLPGDPECSRIAKYAHLVWNGSLFALVWQDNRNPGPSGASHFEIFLRTVTLDAAGAVFMGEGLSVASLDGDSTDPAIAWSGSEFGLAYVNNASGTKSIYFKLLNADGTSKTSDLRLSDGAVDSRNPRIIADGAGYALTWEGTETSGGETNIEIFVARVGWDGSALFVKGVTRCYGDSTLPDIVSWLSLDGQPVTSLCWQDQRFGTTPEIYVARVDISGEKIGYEARVTDTSPPSTGCKIVPIQGGGAAEEVLFWSEGSYMSEEIYFSRFSCF